MHRGRPIPKLVLTTEERETLQGWAQRRKSSQALALRARIVLACAEGKTNTQAALTLRLCKQTVGTWRGRFVAKRLDGLLDEPRPGAPRQISLLRFGREIQRDKSVIREQPQQCGGLSSLPGSGQQNHGPSSRGPLEARFYVAWYSHANNMRPNRIYCRKFPRATDTGARLTGAVATRRLRTRGRRACCRPRRLLRPTGEQSSPQEAAANGNSQDL